jgi:hypothetical protein
MALWGYVTEGLAAYTAAPLAAGFQLELGQAGKRHMVKPGLG